MGNTPSCPPPVTCPPPVNCPPPTLGLNYQPINKNAENTINALQNTIFIMQTIGCSRFNSEIIEFINKQYDVSKMGKVDPKFGDPDVVISTIKKEITNILSKTNKQFNLTLEQLSLLEKSYIELVTIVVNNLVTNGKVDLTKVKQNLLDIFNSFCPPKTSTKSTFGSMESFGSMENDDSIEGFGSMENDDSIEGFGSMKNNDSVECFDSMENNDSVLGSVLGSMEGFGSMENNDSILDSVLGSMERFGSCGSNIFIVILLIVLAVAGYLIYKNRDKIKIPSLPQRIAQFGRQIKSIKKM